MFDDPTLIGPWGPLANRLNTVKLPLWAAGDVRLTDLSDVDDLLAAWADPARTHRVGAALVQMAASDGGNDDDALLLLLHLLSGVVWRLASQLGDLSPDVITVVIGELTCQIRTYRWQTRTRALVTNLEKDTRRAVLGELRPTDRNYPDRVEQLTSDGNLADYHRIALAAPEDEEDLQLIDLLVWAVAHGVDEADVRLLVESEQARGRRGARADEHVAASHNIHRRTLLRRRDRALSALRRLAPSYMHAVA